jgi:hypothetical protein
MWTTVLNAQRGSSNVVFLTLLGGGAFGNHVSWIHAAMRRAIDIDDDLWSRRETRELRDTIEGDTGDRQRIRVIVAQKGFLLAIRDQQKSTNRHRRLDAAMSLAQLLARASRIIFCEAGRRLKNSTSVIGRSRLSGVTTDTAEHSTQMKLSPDRGWRFCWSTMLGPLNLAATVRTGPLGGEPFDSDGSMAHVAAIETDTCPVPPMTPLLARLESLFSAAWQTRLT